MRNRWLLFVSDSIDLGLCSCPVGTMAFFKHCNDSSQLCALPVSKQGSQPLPHHRAALLLLKALSSVCKPPQNPRAVAANLCFPFCSEVTKQNAASASHSSEPTGNHKSEGKHNIQKELAKGQTPGWAVGLGKGRGEPVKAAIK